MKDYSFIHKLSIGLAGLGLAVAIFFSKFLTDKNKQFTKNIILFISVSISYSLLSFIELRMKKNTRNLFYKIELKTLLLINSIIYLIIPLIYMFQL